MPTTVLETTLLANPDLFLSINAADVNGGGHTEAKEADNLIKSFVSSHQQALEGYHNAVTNPDSLLGLWREGTHRDDCRPKGQQPGNTAPATDGPGNGMLQDLAHMIKENADLVPNKALNCEDVPVPHIDTCEDVDGPTLAAHDTVDATWNTDTANGDDRVHMIRCAAHIMNSRPTQHQQQEIHRLENLASTGGVQSLGQYGNPLDQFQHNIETTQLQNLETYVGTTAYNALTPSARLEALSETHAATPEICYEKALAFLADPTLAKTANHQNDLKDPTASCGTGCTCNPSGGTALTGASSVEDVEAFAEFLLQNGNPAKLAGEVQETNHARRLAERKEGRRRTLRNRRARQLLAQKSGDTHSSAVEKAEFWQERGVHRVFNPFRTIRRKRNV
jgi:hypothetical protein